MTLKQIICIITLTFSFLWGETDSSDLLFSDLKANSFYIEFYSDNWEEQLKKNYEIKEFIPAKLKYNGITYDSIGVRYKGNSSYMVASSSVKKPLKFKFNEYRPNQSFYGITRLNFSNNAKDPTSMRETIGYKIARKIDIAPRTSFAKIYIEDEYIGLYTQVEQIDEIFLSKHLSNAEGNLYKASSDGGNLKYRSEDQTDYYNEYELQTNTIINDWASFIDMIEVLNNCNDEDFIEEISKHLNLESCIKHLAFCQVLSNYDSYVGSGRNYYFYNDLSTNSFHMIPWDLNESFGRYSNGWNVINNDVLNVTNLNQKPLLKRIIDNDSLQQIYLGHIKYLVEGPCSSDSIQKEVDTLKEFLDTLIQEDKNNLYSYDNFKSNIEYDLNLGLEQIPGLLSFNKSRNNALSIQLEEYLHETAIKNISNTNNNNSPKIAIKNYNSNIQIAYTFPTSTNNVKIEIFNSQGKKLISQFLTHQNNNKFTTEIEHKKLSKGHFFMHLSSDNYSVKQKLILLN